MRSVTKSYLTASVAAANKTPIGYLDEVTNAGIARGWAVDMDSPNTSIPVHFYIDKQAGNPDSLAGQAATNVARPDVNAAMNIAGNHGFEFSIPDKYRDGKPHTMYAYGIDTSNVGSANAQLTNVKTFTLNAVAVTPAPVPNPTSTTPTTPAAPVVTPVQPPQPVATQNKTPIGYLDEVTTTGIARGWAYDPDTSTTSIPVHFYIDKPAGNVDSLAGQTISNIARSDINTVMKVSGNHGFEFSIPSKYRDGKQHTVYAYGIDTSNVGSANKQLTNIKTFTLNPTITTPTPTPDPTPIGQPQPTGPSMQPSSIVVPQTQGLSSNLPLIVSTSSRIVVMNFETWFGIDGGQEFINDNPSSARPIIYTTPSMKTYQHPNGDGVGYDSSDPNAIKVQLRLLQDAGVDAILVDMTNGIGCTFEPSFCPNDSKVFQKIKSNITVIFKTTYDLSMAGQTKIKIIPLLGAQGSQEFAKNSNNSTGVIDQTQFFINLFTTYPRLAVIYENKPLFVYYHGAPQGPRGSGAWWEQTDSMIAQPFGNKITYRHMGGFLDDQPSNLQNTSIAGPRPIANGLTFWTWIDRYNPNKGYYPSYQKRKNGTVEAFTAAFGAPGKTSAWGSPGNYPSDATLVNNGEAFKRYMTSARTLKPTFLFINQWNEYNGVDQGFDANTRNDIEPNTLIGYDYYNILKSELLTYRQGR